MTTERETRDDDFDLAVDAMRSIDAPSSERAAAVRRAVIEAASQRKSARSSRRSQRKTVTAAILLAAAFGGTAFAAVAAKTSLFARRAQDTHTNSTPSAAAPRSLARRALSRDAIEPAPAQTTVIAAPEPPAPSLALASTPRVATREAAPSRVRRSSDSPLAARPVTLTRTSIATSSERAAATSVAPEADALYHQAHEAHFVTRNPALALDRWDAYLSAEPSGRFVPEAQFNRVVCLVRLGRTQEALAAIDALPSSHYRHADAQRLRAQLEAR